MSEWVPLPTIQDVAKAQADGWEIEGLCGLLMNWLKWNGTSWHENWNYRGRPKPPVKRIVTSHCWRSKIDGGVLWRDPLFDISGDHFERLPAGDLTGEVEE